MIELTINDKKVSVEANTTILEAARSVGIHIPTLCEHKGLTPIGACRVCVVEIEGVRKPAASCHVPVTEGMVIKTDTPRLWELRKMVVELILATHPLDCPTCDKGGECQLQDITYAFGISKPEYKLDNPRRTKTRPNPFLYIDFQKCIQCIRCARYTEEVEGVKAFDYHGGGGYSCEMDRHLERDPEAESIGGVISVCPVGALLNHPMKVHSIRPWQLKTTETTCPHCSDGCRLIINSSHEEIYRVTAPSETDFSQGHPCLRGRFGFGFVNHPSRLKTPLMKVDGVQKEASWDDAIFMTAAKLRGIKEKYGASAVACVPSSRLTDEEHQHMSSFFSQLGGTVALAEAGNSSAASGVKEVFGAGYSRPLSHIDDSDFILIVGTDLTETNPFLANRVSRTARLRDSKAVVINPRKVELTKSTWRWLAPKPGTEAALLTWIGKKSMFPRPQGEGRGEGRFDWLTGIDEAHLEAVTGVSSSLVDEIARAVVNAERPCIIVGDDFSYDDNRSIGLAAANLLVLSGRADAEGSGVFPVLSESNSWGALAIHKNAQEMNALYNSIKEGKIKALYVVGEDPVGDWPAGWEDALKTLELLIVQDSNMTKTAEAANIVLPSLTFAETDGSYSDQDGNARTISAALKPIGTVRPGVAIIRGIAEKFGFHLYPSVNPPAGETKAGTPVPVQVASAIEPPRDYPFLLLTGKRLYGSYSIFEKCKPLLDAYPEAILEMNPGDADALNIKDGDRVKISSAVGSVEAKVSVKEAVQPRNAYLPIHSVNGSQKLTSPTGGPCFVKLEAIDNV